MKKYPNAAEGVRNLFTSQVISLIGALVLGIGVLCGVSAVNSAANLSLDGTVSGALGAGIFGIAGVVLVIVAFVFELIGLNKAKHDNEKFKKAITIIIAGIIASFLGGLIGGTIETICNLFGDVVNIAVAWLIIEAICELLPGTALVEKGKNLEKFIIITIALGFVLDVVGKLGGSIQIIALICSLAAIACNLAYYVMFLSFLKDAKEQL